MFKMITKKESFPRKIFMFWADGIAETNFPTSLEMATLDNIDQLTPFAEIGFYDPLVLPKAASPQTDVVIPYMFYIEPQDFNGRAALELLDAGYPLTEGMWIGSARISVKDRNINWRNSPPLPSAISKAIMEEITSHITSHNLIFILSPFASHRNMLIIADYNLNKIKRLLNKAQKVVKAYGFNLIEYSLKKFKIPPPTHYKVFFAGWAQGSLRGAFRLIGARVNEVELPIFDYAAKRHNFEHFINNTLPRTLHGYDVFTFFVKETDVASHRNERKLKIEALEFMDWMVGKISAVIPKGARIVILGDHPTNLGSPSANIGPTPYLIADQQHHKLSPTVHFCERTISKLKNSSKSIPMAELRQHIYL